MINEVSRGSPQVADTLNGGSGVDAASTFAYPGGSPTFDESAGGITVERFQPTELFGSDARQELFSAVFDFGKKIFSGELDVKPFVDNYVAFWNQFPESLLKDFPLDSFLSMLSETSLEGFMSAGKALLENPQVTKAAFDAAVGLVSAAASAA